MPASDAFAEQFLFQLLCLCCFRSCFTASPSQSLAFISFQLYSFCLFAEFSCLCGQAAVLSQFCFCPCVSRSSSRISSSEPVAVPGLSGILLESGFLASACAAALLLFSILFAVSASAWFFSALASALPSASAPFFLCFSQFPASCATHSLLLRLQALPAQSHFLYASGQAPAARSHFLTLQLQVPVSCSRNSFSAIRFLRCILQLFLRRFSSSRSLSGAAFATSSSLTGPQTSSGS